MERLESIEREIRRDGKKIDRIKDAHIYIYTEREREREREREKVNK